MNRLGWVVLGIALGAYSAAGCGKSGQGGKSASARATAAVGEDNHAAEMLAEKDKTAEARAWLDPNQKGHVLWKGDRAAIRKLIDDLYAAGAKEVLAVDIAKEQEVEIVALFVAVLPAEPEKREKVFDVHNAFWKAYLGEEDPEELKDFLESDKGQKYLVLNFDL